MPLLVIMVTLPMFQELWYTPGATVVQAVCEWLAACQSAECGMERDLRKCYDLVPHDVAVPPVAEEVDGSP